MSNFASMFHFYYKIFMYSIIILYENNNNKNISIQLGKEK